MYRLIIADDEESIRNGIAHSLPWREWGYEVCALCSDGQEVLEQLKLVQPDVLDFLDPNQTTTLLIKSFESLGMNDAQKFGKFYFYLLQENFLRTERYGEVRRDQVVLGSRRVYSALKSGYPYIHVFAIEEKTLYEQVQMERRKQELEMQVLMSQINPHFLYNTLETIVWKASEAGRPDISKMASSLGKPYRLSISGGLFVPLRQELEHVQMYMNIQRIRYGSKIDYEVRLHGCDAASVEVLKLILQPVVENSILYGMEGLEHVLRIRVAAYHRGDKLVLTVTDNGIGMDEAALENLRHQIVHGHF